MTIEKADAARPRLSVDRTAPFLWYTLRVIPQSQARVCQRAKELGIETYVPMSRTPPMVRKFGRNRVVGPEVRPLMPGYVFVSLFALDPRFYLFHGSTEGKEAIHGALRLLSGPEGPMAISEAVVNDMRAREVAGEFDLTGKTDSGRGSVAKWVRRGAFVEIIGGPFESLCGVIEKVKSSTLVTVTVTMLGGESPVDMSVDWIAWRGRGAK